MQQKQLLKKNLMRMRGDWQLYLLLLVPIAYTIIFHYIPIASVQIAFRKYTARDGIWGSRWVGLQYFKQFFESYKFHQVVGNTLILSFLTITLSFPVPILFALMMNSFRAQRLKKVVQTIVTMPHFISVVVLVGILNQLFNSRTGAYGSIMFALTGAYPDNLFTTASSFRIMYVFSGIWQGFGWGSIIYLAALSSVSPDLHESAQIDGASRFQRVLHIDLPSILPTIIIMLILRMGSVMTIGFEKVYLMQNSLNIEGSEVISTYVYKVGLASTGSSNFSYSTAIGLFNSVINLIFVVLFNAIAGRVSETSLW